MQNVKATASSSKHILFTGILLLVSLFLGGTICELGSRLILNEADYLSPKMSRDSVLGHKIETPSAGFDEWGFRNRSVPTSATIVAVGDSHTYGNTATMNDAWPVVLGRKARLDVYNLGLGGYGPNQYYHLLKTKAMQLKPKWVICGLYMGDDFENAFSITHGLESWASLRQGRWGLVNPDNWDPSPPVWGATIRNWLSSHSMIYRIVFHGPIVAVLKESIRFKQVGAGSDPYTTSIIREDWNIREAFRPLGIAESLNQTSGPIREGMRITFQLLEEMDEECRKEGCKFLVVIIPTKETVFAKYIEQDPKLHLYETLHKVIVNERQAKAEMTEYLDDHKIAYVDVLPALERSAEQQLYAQTTRDMHPGRNGYRVIGEAVAEYLSQQSSAGDANGSLNSGSGVITR